MLLTVEDFANVVRSAPLVAIDLLVRAPSGELLVGYRKNPPAKDYWFAPGGRIRKGETLDAAFLRITEAELGVALPRSSASFARLYEHFYEEDFTGATGSGTHYVVLAHVLEVDPAALRLPTDQHDGYRWVEPAVGRVDPTIHPNTRVYFDVP